MKRGLLILLIIMNILPVAVYAQKTAEAEEEALTKGEAVMLLSATDFMRKKIADLLSWTIGYDISKLSRVKLTPSINYVKAVPRKIPPDGRTVFEIVASVDDPGGLGNVAGVRADLSSVGRLPNMMLVDNGLFGDEKAEDGIYTMQSSIPIEVEVGKKEVQIAVANKKGWLALAKTSIDIRKNPAIIEARFTPDQAKADGKEVVILTVRIDNPGRSEDLRGVTADLRAFGYGKLLLLRDDGKGGDLVAGDDVYSLRFIVPRGIKPGEHSIRIGASNLASGYVAADILLKVYK